MSEAMRYEELLKRELAMEARVEELESQGQGSLSEAEALGQWEAFLNGAPIASITRCWREFETPDLQLSSIGLSDAAKDKLRQSMTKNAWALLEEEIALNGAPYLAHSARLRVLRLVRQLEEMGEIGVENAAG